MEQASTTAPHPTELSITTDPTQLLNNSIDNPIANGIVNSDGAAKRSILPENIGPLFIAIKNRIPIKLFEIN